MEEGFSPSTLAALVVDDNHFQRGVTLDILRSIGVGRVVQAANAEEGWSLAELHRPQCIFIDWLSGPFDGVSFIRRMRQSESSPNRTASIFLLSARSSKRDVEAARLAGADAFLRKPVSINIVAKRLASVVAQPREFVETATYIGPCRRRRNDMFYPGPFRRLTDRVEEPVTAEDEREKANLARERIGVLITQAHQLAPSDPNAMRRVFLATIDLKSLATQIGDHPLAVAAGELARYLQAHGAGSKLDGAALSTHIDALEKLAGMPHAMHTERLRVAQSLTRMVDRKLRLAVAS